MCETNQIREENLLALSSLLSPFTDKANGLSRVTINIMEKLIGREIVAVSIEQGYIQLDDGLKLYLDEDEIKTFEEEQAQAEANRLAKLNETLD